MRKIIKETFAEAYEEILNQVYNYPEYEVAPRGFKIKEITNLIVKITNPTSNLFINPIRSTPDQYLAGELIWYFLGKNDLDFIYKYSKFWKKIANKDNTLNSAYGHLLFNDPNIHDITEWEWAVNSLIKDKDSRQALIRFNKPRHSFDGNFDFVCTLNGVFHIREDKLNLTITLRSQDELLGRTFDVPFFTMLMQQMRNHLLDIYPDLEIGSFVHHNISSHIYERNFKLVEEMLNTNEFIPQSLPLIKHDFIDKKGNPTDEFLYLCKCIKDKTIFDMDDPLFEWIFKNSIKGV